MTENKIVITEDVVNQAEKYLSEGCTVIYTAVDNKIAGYLVLSDTIRQESIDMISRIRKLGIEPVLLTGDNANSAKYISSKLGIKEVVSDCMPEDKMNRITWLQKSGKQVCMIGDGINDAPALKTANVGIAMGGVGSDIAVDAADIALVDDEIRELPHLLGIAKRMMITIKCNITFSMTLNFVAIALAVTGVLNPVIGALVHNAGSVLVIISSALLLKWKSKKI